MDLDTIFITIFVALALRLGRKAILFLAWAAILTPASDQMASFLFKPVFHRLRPNHTPGLQATLHYVNNYRGGQFGFAPCYECAFICLFPWFAVCWRLPWLSIISGLWAFAVAYSRVYLDVHFPSDVIVPVFVSPLLAYFASKAYTYSSCVMFPLETEHTRQGGQD